MKKFLFAGAALAVLAAFPASAQPGREGRPMTRAAVEAQVAARFASADANRDGFVTQEEVRLRGETRRANRQHDRGERRAQMFERLDADRDGSISRAEFDARPALSPEDRRERRANRGERRGQRFAQRRGHGAGGAGMMARFGARAFAAMDANRDGRVALAEARGAALARFDRLDSNRDGTIGMDERRAAREARQERREDREER